MRKTIEQLKTMRETEDHVEFKKGEQGNVSYSGGNKVNPSDRRNVSWVMSPLFAMKKAAHWS